LPSGGYSLGPARVGILLDSGFGLFDSNLGWALVQFWIIPLLILLLQVVVLGVSAFIINFTLSGLLPGIWVHVRWFGHFIYPGVRLLLIGPGVVLG